MVPGAPLFPVGLMLDADFTAEGPMGAAGVPPPATWRNKTGAVIETWTNGWSTTFWEVTDITADGGNTTFVFGGAGGQQSGRGFHIDPPSDGPNHGPISTEGGWKIENAIELLDQEEEFFFDEASRTLYLRPNATGAETAPPPATGWVVPQLKQLLRVTGTKAAPVTNVTIRGVGFRDSAYTYLDEWGIPSGGDWALHRGGAVFVEGAERVTVEGCTFTMLDGNALFLSGFTRNVTIQNSTFAYIGDNAMAAWGYTQDIDGGTHNLPKGTGLDGTGGEQPRYTNVYGNIVREIGPKCTIIGISWSTMVDFTTIHG